MLAVAKCEAPPAQPENRTKLPKIAKNHLRWWRLTFRSGQHRKLLIKISFNFKI